VQGLFVGGKAKRGAGLRAAAMPSNLSEVPLAALSDRLGHRHLSHLWFRRYTYGADALDR